MLRLRGGREESRRDESRCDNQPDEKQERGRWQQKQQQLQLRNNQQKRNRAKRRSSSQREVAVQRLTWRRRHCNWRGQGDDDKNTEMTTTKSMMSVAAVSIVSNVRMDAAAPLRQGSPMQGKRSRRRCQHWHQCLTTTTLRRHGNNCQTRPAPPPQSLTQPRHPWWHNSTSTTQATRTKKTPTPNGGRCGGNTTKIEDDNNDSTPNFTNPWSNLQLEKLQFSNSMSMLHNPLLSPALMESDTSYLLCMTCNLPSCN